MPNPSLPTRVRQRKADRAIPRRDCVLLAESTPRRPVEAMASLNVGGAELLAQMRWRREERWAGQPRTLVCDERG